MKTFSVEVSPEAREHVRMISAWWRENRLASPELFTDEVEAALERLRHSPYAGRIYEESPEPDMRRLLMPRTRFYVYYKVAEDSARVEVRAVWHTARGQGPDLP